MCSMKWLVPAFAFVSAREPTPTYIASDTERVSGIGAMSTRMPFESVVRVYSTGAEPSAARSPALRTRRRSPPPRAATRRASRAPRRGRPRRGARDARRVAARGGGDRRLVRSAGDRAALGSAPVEYTRTTLSNGMRVLIAPMPETRSVSLAMYVGVGSRAETKANAGTSHFIEHMLFKGTAKRPSAAEISYAVEALGGSVNASTVREMTICRA